MSSFVVRFVVRVVVESERPRRARPAASTGAYPGRETRSRAEAWTEGVAAGRRRGMLRSTSHPWPTQPGHPRNGLGPLRPLLSLGLRRVESPGVVDQAATDAPLEGRLAGRADGLQRVRGGN